MPKYVCARAGCQESLDLGVGVPVEVPWFCQHHRRDQAPSERRLPDLEKQMARGTKPPEPVLHTPPKKTKYRRTCDHRHCQKFIMLPEGTTRESWHCVEHHQPSEPEPIVNLKPELSFNMSVPPPTKEQYAQEAFNEITKLMAFDKLNADSLLSILRTMAMNVETIPLS